MQTVQQVSTLRTDAWIQIGVDRERADAEALPVGAILPCRTVATRESRETVKALRKRFGSVVTKATIRENALVAEAPRCHQPITAYGPDGAADYRAPGNSSDDAHQRIWPGNSSDDAERSIPITRFSNVLSDSNHQRIIRWDRVVRVATK